LNDQVLFRTIGKLRLIPIHSFSDYYHALSRPLAVRLSLSEGSADLGTALAGAEVLFALHNVGTLLDDLLTLSEDQLDVARVGHVGVDLS
jgi:hypothetical protein